MGFLYPFFVQWSIFPTRTSFLPYHSPPNHFLSTQSIVLHSQTTSLHPSGLSQIMALALLRKWGIEGFLAHVDSVALFYKSKRDMFLRHANVHLKGLAEWNTPQAGNLIIILFSISCVVFKFPCRIQPSLLKVCLFG